MKKFWEKEIRNFQAEFDLLRIEGDLLLNQMQITFEIS